VEVVSKVKKQKEKKMVNKEKVIEQVEILYRHRLSSLNAWEKEFITSFFAKIEKYGDSIFISQKQESAVYKTFENATGAKKATGAKPKSRAKSKFVAVANYLPKVAFVSDEIDTDGFSGFPTCSDFDSASMPL